MMNSGVHAMAKRTRGGGLWAALLVLTLCAAIPAAASPRRYAVVIGNNLSLDEGVEPLSFADDDAVRYYELFSAAGAQTSLFALLDADAQASFPRAARAARPPRAAQVMEGIAAIFEDVARVSAQGVETHFYFVYSGHGNVGPNREGYLSLLDARLGRAELYREVVARSPATYNHLILDACHAYFVVNKRGQADAAQDHREGDFQAVVEDFLRTESLASYPNTGVILGSSSESETHEWSRWEAGIFSHELRSALLGAADVDADGKIRYGEAAACVEAANASVDNPRARLRVFYRPPAALREVPLLDLSAFAGTTWLRVEPEQSGRFYVEDSRGVRLADLHAAPAHEARLALVGEPPFYLRDTRREAKIDLGAEASSGEIRSAALAFTPLSAATRGSIEESFRRHLYETPYGPGFFHGMQATSRYSGLLEVQRSPAPPSALAREPATSPPPRGPGLLTVFGGSGLGLSLATAAVGTVFGLMSLDGYDAYQQTSDPKEARALREQTSWQATTANALFGSAAVIGYTGAVLLLIDLFLADDAAQDDAPAAPGADDAASS